ncbi:S1 family peptidase [Pseudarthrobacter sp. PH31-O2]|uniref:S1 family peptidase n=1 Tax=Micrococcaceae TaxID=1268 RepID=UPI0024B8CDC3|nr:S1 family peptidase [Pseudarthrobacter sp. PH31-O2]MDJ0352600.1 S1 family peptidase [Pseudarthrobacter sp. PH31-O2]
MKTPTFQLTVRAVAAAAIALAGSFYAVPALAEAGGTDPAPSAAPAASAQASPAAPTTPAAAAAGSNTTAADAPGAPAVTAAPGISDAGLAEAIRRDLGITLEEFNAAGQLGRTAADAVPSLRELPGYLGISLRAGKIHIEGSGPELRARVDGLNGNGAADVFVLEAPSAASPAAPTDVPTAAPTPAPTPAPSTAPTPAPSAAELVASNTEQLFQDYVREVGPAGLQAVAYSAGRFVIRTGGTNAAEAELSPAPDQPSEPTINSAPGKISAASFVARYTNVRLEQALPLTTEADVYGGEGYIIDRRTICSTGFGAFSAAGLPLVLTAGHCAEDGTARVAELEPPVSATAGGSAPLPGTRAPLGRFGFSQFGGPLNSWITGSEQAPGNVGTDIAVIESLDGGVNVQPAATTWASAANPGPSAVKIIGVVAPFQGQEVCRSGRTTGWSCGQVEETGVYVVGGRTAAAEDLRAFRGFLSKNVQSSGGDSGGPWISGNFAVGTHSAGETSGENFAIATTLEDALTAFPTAVELQLFLNKPELVAPVNLTVKAGEDITGRVLAAPASAVAANSKVRITVANQAPTEVPVDSAGNWTFRAPLPAGQLAFSAETVNGFSHSGPASFTATVSPAPLPAPGITTPADAALPGLGSVAGTGMPGAVVTLSGDVAGTGTVALDGQWTVPVERPAFGKVTATATLSSPGIADSPSSSKTFTVIPPAPAETTVPDGWHFRQDALPSSISGTGVDGADVIVSIDGAPVGAAHAGAGGAGTGARAVVRSFVPQVLVAGGRWSVPFPSGLAVGAHTLSVTQSVDGVASDPLLVAFTIDARAAVPPARPAVNPPAQPAVNPPAQPAVNPPARPIVVSAGSGRLPDTGAGVLLPMAGLAGGTVLLGVALLAIARRRTVR